jgi:L-aspartate oxidase
MAMAYRVGANMGNMEFVQFHPTAFNKPPAPYFLISESVRGEGGRLYNNQNEQFMSQYHEMMELAPRDIVSRAIYHEMMKQGTQHVYLDISHKDADFLKSRFPFIYAKCKEHNVDITREAIPVAPAAHYICGGVETDIDGRTSILGLYAIGEVACTGVHGANRLASNSLLESIVFAYRAAISADRFVRFLSQPYYKDLNIKHKPAQYGKKQLDKEMVKVLRKTRHEIQETMWKYAGIVRSDDKLQKGFKIIEKCEQDVKSLFHTYTPNRELVELRNLANLARIIIHSAKQRRVNAGTHFNEDLV